MRLTASLAPSPRKPARVWPVAITRERMRGESVRLMMSNHATPASASSTQKIDTAAIMIQNVASGSIARVMTSQSAMSRNIGRANRLGISRKFICRGLLRTSRAAKSCGRNHAAAKAMPARPTSDLSFVSWPARPTITVADGMNAMPAPNTDISKM